MTSESEKRAPIEVPVIPKLGESIEQAVARTLKERGLENAAVELELPQGTPMPRREHEFVEVEGVPSGIPDLELQKPARDDPLSRVLDKAAYRKRIERLKQRAERDKELSPMEALELGYVTACEQHAALGAQLSFMGDCLAALRKERDHPQPTDKK